MASRNRRYQLDMSTCTERFLECSPKMNQQGEQAVTSKGVPLWNVHTLEDVRYSTYDTTDDKQQFVVAAPRPFTFPKYTPVMVVNPMLSTYSFRNNRGETVSGVNVYVDDVVPVESGDADE